MDDVLNTFARIAVAAFIGIVSLQLVVRTSVTARRWFERDGSTQLVALKKVLDMFAEDPNFVKMLVAEYHLSALLKHPKAYGQVRHSASPAASSSWL